ncbi:MAG: hypothetical protein PUC21_09960 [Bacteroidales bacterium]|nr:hypothetical protein [Bacteroidales bacterium]
MAVVNILIQIFWIAVCVVMSYVITEWCLDGVSQPWKIILSGLIFAATYFILLLLSNIIKAFKDPDVQAASELKMDVRRYKQYREWYDEHQRLIEKYGIESKEEQEYFLSFFKKIKNKNEWRRYADYRYRKWREQSIYNRF